MRNRNRLLGVGAVLAAAAIAACLGDPGPTSTTSQEVVIVNNGSAYDFGAVMVGDFKTSGSIVIAPQSQTDDDAIVSIDASGCAEFTVNPHPPLPGSSAHVYNDCISFGGAPYGGGMSCTPVTYDFDATYTPSGAGAASCSVRITVKPAGGSGGLTSLQLFTLNGTGTAPSFGMTVTPTTPIQFGDVVLASPSSPRQITVRNAGTQTLTVSGSNSDPARFLFVEPLTAHSLAAGATETYNVRCRPGNGDDGVTFTGSVTFSAPGATMQSVGFSCHGITSALELSESPAAFPSTLVGVMTSKTITVDSPLPQTLTSIALDGTTSSEVTLVSPPASGTTFGSGATPLSIALAYSAATAHPSGPIGNLVIKTTSEPAGRTVSLSAEALPGQIGTTPSVVDFGPVCGGSSPSVPVQIYASAAGSLQLTGITSPSAPFAVTDGSGGLKGNHGPPIVVTASVSATTPGELSDMFVVNSNAPSEPMHPVSMHAVVLPAGVSPTPQRQHFGGSMLNQPVVREVVISNCGTAPINITGARITGVSALDFTIVDPANPAMALAQLGSATFLIAMTPHTNGVKDAQLVVDYEGGSVTAALDGNGFGGDDGTSGDRKTYYACSTGQPGALWPVALAVVALVVRRRRRK